MAYDAQRYAGWSGLASITGAIGMGHFGLQMTSHLDFLTQQVPKVDYELGLAQQYILPRQAYTQRQKALQAIHSSQMTTRSALGQEASYCHR